MNVTYKDLKEGYILEDGDEIIIHGVKHIAYIDSVAYLHFDSITEALEKSRIPKIWENDYIFEILHIEDKYNFVNKIVGSDCWNSGIFPEVKTAEALTKVVIALLEKPLYNVGDYVTIREEIEGHNYSTTYWEVMKEFVGRTFAITKIVKKTGKSIIIDGEMYLYELNDNYLWWDIAMIMPATEEEKKLVDVPDKGEPEEEEEEKIHYVTLEDLNCGYVFKRTDHIKINGMDCVIHTSTDDARFWLSSDAFLEQEIFDSLGIPDDKKKELASLCGAVDLSFNSPEFDSLMNLSDFVRRILMYKKEDKPSPKKKWSGNPTYFDLMNGRVLEKDDILNIHGIEYRVTDGGSDGTRCWLTTSYTKNSAIFDKLRIEDKSAFVRGICPIVDYGAFPEVGSYEDLTKVAIALFEVPEFKVGDKVRVAHREDAADDYPYTFVDEMAELEGEKYTIMEAENATFYSSISDKAKERLNKDPNYYCLDAEGKDFDWHSSMLEKVSESDKKSEEESFVKPSQISLSDLQSGYILKYRDTVVLCGETYQVYGPDCCFLNNISGGPNHSVFNKLGIKDKMNFCSSYGDVSSGDFPEFNRFDALTACVKQLMILEEQYSCCKGDCEDTPMFEAIKFKSFDFAMDIIEPDEPSDTGNVRLPEIKDDFKIIL